MSCYEQFGWSPQAVRELPGREAELLSIYFEELSAHHAKQARKIKSQSSSGGGHGARQDEVTEWELKDDDYDSDDYSAYLEPEE